MKNFVRSFLILSSVSVPQLSLAAVDFMAEALEKIKVVSIAPALQELLNKASPEDRERLEAAINAGNEFIPLHFSGKAYDTTPENAEWQEVTAPLVALDRKGWERQYELLEMNSKKISSGKDVAYTYRLTCPQIALIAVQQDEQSTTLIYRTHSVGMLIDDYRHDLFNFNKESAEEAYDLRIEVAHSFLINKALPPDKWVTWSYTRPIDFMKEFLNDHRSAVFTTKEHENEKIKIYRKTIKAIEESAARICK